MVHKEDGKTMEENYFLQAFKYMYATYLAKTREYPLYWELILIN